MTIFDCNRYNDLDKFCEQLAGFSSVEELTAQDVLEMHKPELLEDAYRHFEALAIHGTGFFVGYFGMTLDELCLEICLYIADALDYSEAH